MAMVEIKEEGIVLDKMDIVEKINELLKGEEMSEEQKERLYNLKRMSNRLKGEAILKRANRITGKDIIG